MRYFSKFVFSVLFLFGSLSFGADSSPTPEEYFIKNYTEESLGDLGPTIDKLKESGVLPTAEEDVMKQLLFKLKKPKYVNGTPLEGIETLAHQFAILSAYVTSWTTSPFLHHQSAEPWTPDLFSARKLFRIAAEKALERPKTSLTEVNQAFEMANTAYESVKKQILYDRQIALASEVSVLIGSLAENHAKDLPNLAGSLEMSRKAIACYQEAKTGDCDKFLDATLATLYPALDLSPLHLAHQLRTEVSLRLLAKKVPGNSELLTQFRNTQKTVTETTYQSVVAPFSEKITRFAAASKGKLDGKSLFALSPEAARSEAVGQWNVLRQATAKVRAFLTENRGFLAKFQTSPDGNELTALKQMEGSLYQLSRQLESAPSTRYARNLYLARTSVRYLATAVLNAASSHSSTALILSERLEKAVNRFHGNTDQFLNEEDYRTLRKAINSQTADQVYSAWVNRGNVRVAAISTLLLGELAAMPFSGGTSGAAIPLTLKAIGAATFAANTALAGASALDIADRATAKGWAGVTNVDSAIDALLILSVLPRPIVRAVTPLAETTLPKRVGEEIRNHFSYFQYDASKLLKVGLPAYAMYQWYYADKLSLDYAKNGVEISPAELRRAAWTNLAISIIARAQNAKYQAKGEAAYGEAFTKGMEVTNRAGQKGLNQMRNMLWPPRAGMQYLEKNPGASYARTKALAITAGYVAYDYVVANSATLLSFGTADFSFNDHWKKEKPLPELNAGETAVAMVGFDPVDLLYFGSRAEHTHEDEIRKYGDKYFIYDFRSPELWIEKMRVHAQTYGKIKYLKILTHGRPGRFYSPLVHNSPEADGNVGWVTEDWMKKNADYLNKVIPETFAPEARVILFACLVGSNLDKESDGQPTNVGEKFLDQFAELFLQQGGRLDVSTRMLVGLDTVLGSAFEAVMDGGVLNHPDRASTLLPLSEFEAAPQAGLFRLRKGPETDPDPIIGKSALVRAGKVVTFTGERLAKMVWQMPKLWYRYGINLEGPWWIGAERYKSREIPSR